MWCLFVFKKGTNFETFKILQLSQMVCTCAATVYFCELICTHSWGEFDL